MRPIDLEIKAYEKMKEQLEAEHWRQWVVFHREEFRGAFDDFQDAAEFAIQRFGRGPYLIEQVGAPPPMFPSVFGFKTCVVES